MASCGATPAIGGRGDTPAMMSRRIFAIHPAQRARHLQFAESSPHHTPAWAAIASTTSEAGGGCAFSSERAQCSMQKPAATAARSTVACACAVAVNLHGATTAAAAASAAAHTDQMLW